MTKLSLTIPEAAEAASVTERTIRAWIANGWLKAKRQSRKEDDRGRPVGEGVGKYLVRVADLEACLDSLPDG